jgi:Domain of unknown function (DUF4157)
MPSQHKTQTKTSEHDRTSKASTKANFSAAPSLPPMLHLQRQVGNQAVGRLIQAKLTVGEPNDVYEQEADRVAAAVVSQIHAPQNVSTDQTASVQRQAIGSEGEELRTKPLIQRKSDVGGMAVSSEIEFSIQQARGSGQSLAESIRTPMEQAFGADFSRVRVHTDERSDRLNQAVGARAFTTGQDVFFRQGEYDPGNRGGQELIAHELTHVMQQVPISTAESNSTVQRMLINFDPKNQALSISADALQEGDPLEFREADLDKIAQDEVLHLLGHGNKNSFAKFDQPEKLLEYLNNKGFQIVRNKIKAIQFHGCNTSAFAAEFQELINKEKSSRQIDCTGATGLYETAATGIPYVFNYEENERPDDVAKAMQYNNRTEEAFNNLVSQLPPGKVEKYEILPSELTSNDQIMIINELIRKYKNELTLKSSKALDSLATATSVEPHNADPGYSHETMEGTDPNTSSKTDTDNEELDNEGGSGKTGKEHDVIEEAIGTRQLTMQEDVEDSMESYFLKGSELMDNMKNERVNNIITKLQQKLTEAEIIAKMEEEIEMLELQLATEKILNELKNISSEGHNKSKVNSLDVAEGKKEEDE